MLPTKARAADTTFSFDLDAIYSSPSIVGTTPQAAVWSMDGNHVAFLWNDEGHTFRDVWVYSLVTTEKRRLTELARSTAFDQEHPGISEVIWLGNSENSIAYVLNKQLYVRGADGVTQQIEADRGVIGQLAVSPDGRHFSFVADGSLWVRSNDVATSKPSRKLVDRGNPQAEVESYYWSADSKGIAFQLTDNSFLPERDIYYYAGGGLQNNRVSRAFPGDETAHFRIGFVRLEKQQPRFFERPDDKHHIWSYALSRNGKSLFINSSDLLVKEHTVYIYDVASGSRETFYKEYDAKHLRPDWKVAWAPEDDGLIILTDRDGYLHLYHQKTAGSKSQALTSGPWEISDFKVDALEGQIYFIANKSHLAERQIYRVPVVGGAIERVSAENPGTHDPVFSPDMRHAATFFSNDATPLELYVIDLDSKETKRVTQSPRPEFYQQSWANIG